MRKFPIVRFKQIVHNPLYVWFWLKRSLWLKRTSFQYVEKYANVAQRTPAETLAYLIEHNGSIIRFGDGEFALLSGAGIYPPDSDWSQRYSAELARELIRELQLQHPKILLAVPPIEHLTYREGEIPARDIISSMHTEARMFLWRYLQPNTTYGDWSVFMPHHHEDMDWPKIANYVSTKTVVVVTGGTDKLAEVKLGARTLFVECGKHNAFERREEILAQLDALIAEKKLDPEQTLFWISLGCTAGCIVEHLVEQGYVAWDTGHIFRFASKELKALV